MDAVRAVLPSTEEMFSTSAPTAAMVVDGSNRPRTEGTNSYTEAVIVIMTQARGICTSTSAVGDQLYEYDVQGIAISQINVLWYIP